jgi:hypothetical protein
MCNNNEIAVTNPLEKDIVEAFGFEGILPNTPEQLELDQDVLDSRIKNDRKPYKPVNADDAHRVAEALMNGETVFDVFKHIKPSRVWDKERPIENVVVEENPESHFTGDSWEDHTIPVTPLTVAELESAVRECFASEIRDKDIEEAKLTGKQLLRDGNGKIIGHQITRQGREDEQLAKDAKIQGLVRLLKPLHQASFKIMQSALQGEGEVNNTLRELEELGAPPVLFISGSLIYSLQSDPKTGYQVINKVMINVIADQHYGNRTDSQYETDNHELAQTVYDALIASGRFQ